MDRLGNTFERSSERSLMADRRDKPLLIPGCLRAYEVLLDKTVFELMISFIAVVGGQPVFKFRAPGPLSNESSRSEYSQKAGSLSGAKMTPER